MKNLSLSGRRVPPTQSYPKHFLIPVGATYGRWEVIETGIRKKTGNRMRHMSRVRCTCEAGTIATVQDEHLRSGHSKSCGCLISEIIRKAWTRHHPLIPVGAKFGKWEVIENGLYKKYGQKMLRACRVRCECGTEIIHKYGVLRSGLSPSCGCRSPEQRTERWWKALRQLIKCRGWGFHLTLSQLETLSLMNCAYCGREPSNILRLPTRPGGYYQRLSNSVWELRYSGLDRVDSAKGYVPGNVVPSCGICNIMKSDYSVDEFYVLMERIRLHGSTGNTIRELAASL